MLRKASLSLSVLILTAITCPLHAAKIIWTDGVAGLVPGSLITYTVTGNHDETTLITDTGTFDGDHTWDPVGTGYRKRGGDLTSTITFSAPIPINLLTAAATDLNSGMDMVTVAGGTAGVGDLVNDPGLVNPASSTDLDYDDTTGALTRVVLDGSRHDAHLFGTSPDTLTSLTLSTSNIGSGDWVLHYFGFTGMVPEPSSMSLALGFIGLLGIRSRRHGLANKPFLR